MQHNKKVMSNSNKASKIVIVIAVLIIATIAVFAFKSLSKSPTVQTTNQNIGDAQIVNVRVQGSEYVLTPPTFTEGQPVVLQFDMSTVQGCSRSVVLPDFGVRKYLSEKDNTIIFTPLKSGTFRIQCSMNMYRGQFVVTSDGSTQTENLNQAAVYQDTQVPTQQEAVGGSCGGGSGGCGCGMR